MMPGAVLVPPVTPESCNKIIVILFLKMAAKVVS